MVLVSKVLPAAVRTTKDNPTQEHEDDPGMDEVDPEETRRELMTTLAEKITSLEKENEENELRIQELEMKMVRLARAAQENAVKHAAVERAIREIVQHAQGRQHSTRAYRAPSPVWRNK